MRKPILHWLLLVVSLGWIEPPIALGQLRDWPWLGVVITDVNGNFTGGGGGGGSYVTGVDHAGPASSAGLMRHDIIIAIDGRAALNPRELTCLIQGRRPGDIVSVTVMRAGQPTSLSTTLGRWPDGKEFPRPAAASCGKDPVSNRRGDQRFAGAVVGRDRR
jgi:PDZ domain